MSKKNYFKRVICSAIAFVVMLSLFNINVFAESTEGSTKVVTITEAETRTIHSSNNAIEVIMDEFEGTTYSYDDGTYTGTLTFYNATDITQISAIDTFGGRYYVYTFNVIYTGTVSKYIQAVTKEVTTTKDISTTVHYSQVSSLLSSYNNTTTNYDDESYKGTLNFSKITDVKQNGVIETFGGRYYLYSFKVVYSGIVTKYIP